jgi:SDR family mycofactocin-dependent oxidoreductase
MTPAQPPGRVALVTGAGRGIGAATVGLLAEQGWQVLAVDRCSDEPAVPYPMASRDELEAVAAVAAAWPGQVRTCVADVRDAAAMHDAVARCRTEFGGLDAAVGAAAVIAGGAPLWETSAEQWDILWDTDVRGLINLATAAVPLLLERPQPRQGRFVALASAAGHRGLWHLAAYSTVKHAVVGLVRGLATDLRGSGITASAVSPGSTRTRMLDATAELYGLDDVTTFADSQLTERLLDPVEVAATVAWLCSEASSAITGTVVHADGGFTV